MNDMQEIPDDLQAKYNWKMFGDYFCPVWKKEKGPIAKGSPDNFFRFPDAIQYRTFKEPTGKKENASEILPAGFSKPKQDYKQSVLAESGYLRPHFRFVSQRVFPIKEDVDERVKDLKKDRDKNEEIEVLNSLTTYRDSLMTQIKRQAEKVGELNRHISDMLKVYYHETVTSNQSESELSQKEKQELGRYNEILRLLFSKGILKGGYPEDIKQFTEELKTNDYIHQSLNDRVVYGVDYLVDKREAYLKVAVILARKINRLESIIELLMTGKELTNLYFRRRNMPDPKIIANQIKSRQYEPAVIEEAMTITREYILRENIQDAYNHVETIKDEVRNQDISKPSRNTLRSWIKLYCKESGVL